LLPQFQQFQVSTSFREYSQRDIAGCLDIGVDRDRHTMSLRALKSFQKAKACSLLLQM